MGFTVSHTLRTRFLHTAMLITLLSLVVLPCSTGAQTVGGSIAGVVRDSSGAVLPGVTVEAASPALIEKVRTAVSDAAGNYRIPELRPGEYTVTFTLPGFSVVKREGLELTTGFTATVNADMRVGGLEETITVAGASPVVDIQNVRQQTTFSRDLLDTLPTNRSVAGFATLTLGAQLNSPTQQNVGGNQSEAASAGGFSIHGGRSDDQKLTQDGMVATDASFAGQSNRNAINQVAVQEMIFQTGGGGAESETGGVQINVVPREGGNTFSTYFKMDGATPSMQTDNLSDELRARGLKKVPSIKKIYDVGGAFGGPIKRDSVWFFTSSRIWGSQNYAPGNYFNKTQSKYIGAPNSGVALYTPDLDRPAYSNGYLRDIINVRVTWKATEKSKFNFAGNVQKHCDCFRGVDGLLAPEAVQQRLYGPASVSQESWSYPASNNLLFEAGNTVAFYVSETGRAPGILETDIPITEQSTGYSWGAAQSASTNYAHKYKKFGQANQRFISSYLTGSHTLKAGLTTQEGWNFDRTESNYLVTPYGKAQVAYRFNNGVPNRITEYTELEGWIRLKMNLGAFIQDQWTFKRMTLNGGLRYSYFNAYTPATTLKATMFTAPLDAPAVKNIPNWSDFTPRMGVAYDVAGNGKTAVKASLGRYVAYEGLTGIPRANGPTRRIAASATRTWTDTNGNFYPDCLLTNPLAQNNSATGGDVCGQISNLNLGKPIPTTTYADDVLHDNRGSNWQGAVSVQQELVPGMALNVGYYRTWYSNMSVSTNAALTAADFDSYCVTAPTDTRLGSASGQRICGLVDVKPAKFGQVSDLITQSSNFGKQNEIYNGVDIGVNSRFGQGGILQGGVSFGRTVTNNCDVVQNNPQIALLAPAVVGAGEGGRADDAFCKVSNGNQTQFKAAGNYPLPWFGLEASATYQNNPGLVFGATVVVPNAQIAPALGRNLSDGAAGNRTVALVKPYTKFGDRVSQVDIRFGKRINFGRGKLRGMFDIYNLFNASTVLSQNNAYGASWQTPNSILGGRLFKFGVQIDY